MTCYQETSLSKELSVGHCCGGAVGFDTIKQSAVDGTTAATGGWKMVCWSRHIDGEGGVLVDVADEGENGELLSP